MSLLEYVTVPRYRTPIPSNTRAVAKMTKPDPHGKALKALSRNPKLPDVDKPRVDAALERYNNWLEVLKSAEGEGDVLLEKLVSATNEYKKFIEFDLIFCSEQDFLYRSSGQLKIINTIMEEFLPYLVDERLIPGIVNLDGCQVGPQACYSGLFIGPPYAAIDAGLIYVKKKDQDFTVGRKLYLKASTRNGFEHSVTTELNVAYFVSEIKTNLDKTMFQEAAATARELKASVGDAVYVLLCEWLDMPPIDTRVTSIDEVIILRKAKRLGSGQRATFSSAQGRKDAAVQYEQHLDNNPLNLDSFRRLIFKLNESFPPEVGITEGAVLEKGYF